jgi:DNA polymerase/3'-5' exonuclease PolX
MRDQTNSTLAGKLREMADVLERQAADKFRVGAYRRAADSVESLDRLVREIVKKEGLAGLIALPGIGRGIGLAIIEMLTTGRSSACRACLSRSSCFRPCRG